jgi:hypothetical protein
MNRAIELARRNVALTALMVFALSLLILNPFFYMGWQSANDRQAELEKEEMMANLQLMSAQANYDLNALRGERDGLLAEIAALVKSTMIPEAFSSADVYETMAQEAKYRVTLVSLSSVNEPSYETIGENTYEKYEINVSVAGSLTNIVAFLNAMETEEKYPSLRFEDVTVSKSESQDWEGDLKLVILCQA